jgi:hypothetical protein
MREPSNLFYQSRQRRPLVGEARGVYIWDADGKRYLDGSSGAMVANIGHSNERVLAAMREQMKKATFAYRLHFENEPAAEARAAIRGRDRPAETLEDHIAPSLLPWQHDRGARRDRHGEHDRAVRALDPRDAEDTGADLLSRP